MGIGAGDEEITTFGQFSETPDTFVHQLFYRHVEVWKSSGRY